MPKPIIHHKKPEVKLDEKKHKFTRNISKIAIKCNRINFVLPILIEHAEKKGSKEVAQRLNTLLKAFGSHSKGGTIKAIETLIENKFPLNDILYEIEVPLVKRLFMDEHYCEDEIKNEIHEEK